MTEPCILIIGPNSTGKTTFFNNFVQLSSIRKDCYPGTRVNVNSGYTTIDKIRYQVIDAPGIYSLVPTSENEIVTLNLILNLQPEKIIFITREESMEYNIQLMIQLAELGIPFLTCFYRKNDFYPMPIEYAEKRLCRFFNTSLIYTTPAMQLGINQIRKSLHNLPRPRWVGGYSKHIERKISDFEDSFREHLNKKIPLRFLAIMAILKNQIVLDWLRKHTPEETWSISLNFSRLPAAMSMSIAIRWQEATQTLLEEITLGENTERPKQLALLDKYSLSFFWDWVIVLGIVTLWYSFMRLIGTNLLVNIFYSELFSKYLEPFFINTTTLIFGQTKAADFFIGQYGLLTIGFPYAFTVILPTLFVFFLIYSYLDEVGLITRIAMTTSRLLSIFGLNGYVFPHLMLATSCKINAFLKTRTLETNKEKTLVFLILLFGIPCFSQFAIISNLLAIIPIQYLLIYLGLILSQILIILRIYSFFHPEPTSNFVVKLTPLRVPNTSTVFHKTWMYVRWYIQEIAPLVIISTVFLFGFDSLSLLDKIKDFLNPIVSATLNLPDKFVDTVILGLFRKDFGAVSLYDLANSGLLNSIQVLVATVFLTLSIPCLGFIGSVIKEKGWRYGIATFLLSTFYGFTIAVILNKILRF